jgi:low affinity Fe/Cu permease
MVRDQFRRFANWSAERVGSPWAFFVSVGLIIVWGVAGPRFHYSDEWQLVMNTGTNIITFLMVFLIQAMQNRDAKAMHLKLDELLRAVKSARTSMVALEHMSDDDLDALAAEFQRIKERHRNPVGQINPAPPPETPAK